MESRKCGCNTGSRMPRLGTVVPASALECAQAAMETKIQQGSLRPTGRDRSSLPKFGSAVPTTTQDFHESCLATYGIRVESKASAATCPDDGGVGAQIQFDQWLRSRKLPSGHVLELGPLHKTTDFTLGFDNPITTWPLAKGWDYRFVAVANCGLQPKTNYDIPVASLALDIQPENVNCFRIDPAISLGQILFLSISGGRSYQLVMTLILGTVDTDDDQFTPFHVFGRGGLLKRGGVSPVFTDRLTSRF